MNDKKWEYNPNFTYLGESVKPLDLWAVSGRSAAFPSAHIM